MTYQAFTKSQRATVKALVAEMKQLSELWIDTPCAIDPAIGSRADWLYRCAMDWDQDGSYQERGAYIRDLRHSVKNCRRSQAEVFKAIRALGFICRKTDCGEYRVADPSVADLSEREWGASYCADLAEALATAVAWSNDRKAAADRAERDQILTNWTDRARQLLAAKRVVYGDRFATAAEAEMQAEDPLAWLELIADQLTAETGLTYRGSWAWQGEIERATAAAAAEDLDAKAAAIAQPSDRVELYAPSPAQRLEISARTALFALESAIMLQGLHQLAPAAQDLRAALALIGSVEERA